MLSNFRDILLMAAAAAASGVIFGACQTREDPVVDTSSGCGGSCSTVVTGCSGVDCSTSASCSETGTTTSTTDITPLTTTLACAPPEKPGTCTSGAVIPCFDGTAADLAASCIEGTRTCAPTADGFAPECVGQVAPAPDGCDAPAAWSCGGTPPVCGPGRWAQTFQGTGTESATSLAIDGSGNVVAAVSSSGGRLVFGTSTANVAGGGSAVVKLDHEGKALWARDVRGATGTVVAVDSTGAIYAGGTFLDSMSIGTTQLTGMNGGQSGFVAKFAANGETVWLHRIQETGAATVNAIAIATNGTVIVAGSYGDSATVGFASLPKSDRTSGLVASLAADSGVARWASGLVDGGDIGLRAISIAPGGDVLVAGTKMSTSVCDQNPHYARLSASGNVKKHVSLSLSGVAFGVAADGSGGAWLTGSALGTVSVEGKPVGASGFLVHVNDDATTDPVRPFADWEGRRVAIDDAGSVVVAGLSHAGDAAHPASGHLLKVDAKSHVFFDQTFAPTPLAGDSTATLSVEGLAIAPNHDIVIGGGIRGTANIGAGAAPPETTSITRLDSFVARLGP